MFARSGLFSAQRQARSAAALPERLAIKGQMRHSLDFEGPRLSMNDKAVYEAVVVLAKSRKHDLNEPLLTSLSAIAHEMGWANRGGRSLAWIWDALERLAKCEVSFELANGARASGKLLETASKSHAGVHLVFDPAFVLAAFGDGQQFKIDRARRRKLGSPLAQWLHDFLSTHKAGQPLTLDYLKQLCGSNASSKRFCRVLREVAATLCQAAPELAKSFKIEDGRRSSERWSVEFERGSEPCDFFSASEFRQQRAEKSARQRGLNL